MIMRTVRAINFLGFLLGALLAVTFTFVVFVWELAMIGVLLMVATGMTIAWIRIAIGRPDE